MSFFQCPFLLDLFNIVSGLLFYNRDLRNFLSAQRKELLPEYETITVLDPNELKKFKEEAYATYSSGERKHQQAAAYILMLNTGARHGEILIENREIVV